MQYLAGVESVIEDESLKNLIQELYWQEELSQQLIANRIGCSRAWVGKLMQRYQIPTRDHQSASNLVVKHQRTNFAEIRRKGIETLKKEVALGLREWNRPGRYGPKIRALEQRLGKTFRQLLQDLYWEKQMTSSEIASYLNQIMQEIPGPSFQVLPRYVC